MTLLTLRLAALSVLTVVSVCVSQMQAFSADPDVTKVIEQIRKERRWKELVTEPTPEFLEAASKHFTEWGEVLARLSAEQRHDEADQIVTELLELRKFWGNKIFPPEKFDAFVRDTFYVKGAKVIGFQFFEPVEFYKGDPALLKFYRFSVYDKDKVVMRYYLERSEMIEPYFVLGRMTPENSHKQVQPYGSKMPSYWTLRADTIADLSK